MTRHIWYLVTLISLGGCFELYDLFLTAYIAPGLNRAGYFTPRIAGRLQRPRPVSAWPVSAPSCSPCSPACSSVRSAWATSPTSYGRRTVFTFSLVWYSITHRHHGVPDLGLRRRSLALHRRHRHRRRTGDDRHLRRRTGAAAPIAAAPLPTTSSSSSSPCRSWPSSPGCWCRTRRSASTAGAGWC